MIMNDNNNNNNNNNNRNQLPQIPLQAIEGLEQYLERNGLHHQNQQNYSNENQTIDNQELAQRIAVEETYKQTIVNQFLKENELQEEKLNPHRKNEIEEKKCIVKLCGDKTMKIVTSRVDDEIFVSLALFVDTCDTIYAFVKSDHWLPSSSSLSSSATCNIDTYDSGISFSLSQFNHESILEFISILQQYYHHHHQQQQQLQNQTKPIPNDNIIIPHPDHIIECCKISHYLQCQSILNDIIIPIIQESIDDSNCASICILADQLNIPSLMNTSMEHVMDKLDIIQNHDVWNDFPLSLKHHIKTLHNAARSSIIVGRGYGSSSGRSSSGGKRSTSSKKVLFTSSHEFLSIFHDTLREHKERLNEAKIRQEEIIQERIKQNQTRGRYAKEIDVYGGDVRDAAMKIEKQKERVRTLEIFYKEQKMIFARDAVNDGNYKSSFSL